MTKHALTGVALAASFAFPGLPAAPPPPPPAYSLTEVNGLTGPAKTLTIYRKGSKALVDASSGGTDLNPTGEHTRTLWDVKAQTSVTWDLLNPSLPCTAGTSTEDWGDPFAASAMLSASMTKQKAMEVGDETIAGISTKILETPNSGGQKYRVWLDPKSGLVMRALAIYRGITRTLVDVREVKLEEPDDSVFALPNGCAAGGGTAKGKTP